MTLRVDDCHVAYEALRERGAEFLTPPYDWGGEVRCFLQEPRRAPDRTQRGGLDDVPAPEHTFRVLDGKLIREINSGPMSPDPLANTGLVGHISCPLGIRVPTFRERRTFP